MRVLTATAVAALVGALGVSASPADTPARAEARAVLVSGTLGTFSSARAAGDSHDFDSVTLKEAGVDIDDGEVSVTARRGAPVPTARATAAARSLSLLDGLVTAYGLRRSAIALANREVAYSGRVSGLRIGDRLIGDVESPQTYQLPDGAGTVHVNRGAQALVLTLARETAGYAAGTRVVLADVSAHARAARAVTTRRATAGKTARKAAAAKPSARRARRAAARQRLLTGRYVFPVFGSANIADDWGAPRQIGAHQGNDIFAPFGAPVLAVADGVVEKVGTLPISGNRLWLRTDGGDTFFYAHLSAFAPSAVSGRRVRAGALLGFVGNTGDAEPTPPHVHFEIHPEDGKATDPHAILEAWRRREVRAGGWLARYGGAAEQPGALVEVRDFIAE